MKLFELRRSVGKNEIWRSMQDTVAQGVVFDNGRVCLTWLSDVSSVAMYDSIEDVVKIHGHAKETRVVQVFGCDLDEVQAKYVNYIQDEIEGVEDSMKAAGGSGKYMVEQRNWWARLFRTEYLDTGNQPNPVER